MAALDASPIEALFDPLPKIIMTVPWTRYATARTSLRSA